MALVGFPQFSQLPAELRLSIWEAAASSPSMHLFDVCLPSSPSENDNDNDNDNDDTKDRKTDRTKFAFSHHETALSTDTLSRYHKFKDTVFLDTHHNTDGTDATNQRLPRVDPSMYLWKMSLGAACVDAFAATILSVISRKPSSAAAVVDDNINTVYLPGPDRRIQYNNQTDVLHLCLSSSSQSRRFIQDPVTVPTTATICPSSLSPSKQSCALNDLSDTESMFMSVTDSEIEDINPTTPSLLDAQWSDEMAETLRNARRIALDAAHTSRFVDMSSPLGLEELAMLACTLHQGLEVLYLVDYCPGQCQDCARPGIKASNLTKKGEFYKTLNDDGEIPKDDVSDTSNTLDDRAPDVIWGVGRVYREVFDLEGLGWTDEHPAFNFGRALGAMIRAQQQDVTETCQFQGVRVLVVEDE